MVQRKISSFFKRSSAQVDDGDGRLAIVDETEHAIDETCECRAPESNGTIEIDDGELGNRDLEEQAVNKKRKRSYAQVHLELGQSDFLLRGCSICGIKYTPGNALDEKSHARFHKNYTHGVPFKGWCEERLVGMPLVEGGRVIVVLDSDPRPRRNKVQEVVQMMENELGSGWIYHKLCKVYLFIESQRIAGCLVAEPIKEAFKVISRAVKGKPDSGIIKTVRKGAATLQFGNAIFQREAVRRSPPVAKNKVLDENLMGAIYCEDAAVPAVCGIRAIWVTPSNRRKRVATHLVDAARRSFCEGYELEHSQLAFSEPTSAGRALASSYLGSRPLLVYRAL
ncbi:protein CHROMOSOME TRANSMISSION FIDELITY 7-like [Punica granatum]|uniref:Protein CHROMOSOME TRANSMISSION FIDELITY 7-like n=1 Tax=Punica granatum TaxID=22663 RepID=A0A218X1F4_PUNGR|nr:protein CHROMOSOME TRANSMISSION FIDELITY 7-like [Punica granatum]XP_031384222.1 protein CHROMOSOME TRANSMISSION FIDELITY 7-like [Punica granatum]OWM79035.1 hypothetical protein CDL15_Pgr003206 [Punica granatum]